MDDKKMSKLIQKAEELKQSIDDAIKECKKKEKRAEKYVYPGDTVENKHTGIRFVVVPKSLHLKAFGFFHPETIPYADYIEIEGTFINGCNKKNFVTVDGDPIKGFKDNTG